MESRSGDLPASSMSEASCISCFLVGLLDLMDTAAEEEGKASGEVV